MTARAVLLWSSWVLSQVLFKQRGEQNDVQSTDTRCPDAHIRVGQTHTASGRLLIALDVSKKGPSHLSDGCRPQEMRCFPRIPSNALVVEKKSRPFALVGMMLSNVQQGTPKRKADRSLAVDSHCLLGFLTL